MVPIGFVSDHMEVIYDLDTEAQAIARDRGVNMVRAPTVGVHPKFLRNDSRADRGALGIMRAARQRTISRRVTMYCPAGLLPSAQRAASNIAQP